MQHALPDHPAGSALEGRYELGPRIAHGGTATVYRAVDARLQRVVAVKLMHPHLAEDPVAAGRFVREARAAARLSHPHVVSVLDQGRTADGLPYLVMEHVAGETLRDLLRRRGALSPREALDVLEPVLDGLAAAHRAGLVHRDVKPENVLIARGGRITVADFGLSRAVGQHTASGTVLGTVGYASPELVTGRPVGTRADVYSAGIVAFELLAGRRPFDGSPLAVAQAHAQQGVPDLRALDPGVPAALARLVARATSRDPGERPEDAGRLLDRLRAVRAQLRPAELDRPPRPVADAPTEMLSPHATPTEVLRPHAVPTQAAPTGGAPTEVLRPHAAPTEATPTGGAPTEVLRSHAAPTQAAPTEVLHPSGGGGTPPGRPGGSSSPGRPEVELRPARPLRTAAVLALAALAVAAAAFLGWLIGTGPGGAGTTPGASGTVAAPAQPHPAGTDGEAGAPVPR